MLLIERQRLRAITRRQDPVVKRFQHFPGDLQQRGFILHQQDGFTAPHLHGGQSNPDKACVLRARRRQIHAEHCSPANLADQFNEPVMGLNYGQHGRQPNAGAFTWLFGGEKWLIYLIEQFRWNAATGIRHAQHDMFP